MSSVTRTNAAAEGSRAAVPAAMGLAPFAVAVGAAMAADGVRLGEWMGGPSLIGGAAQLSMAELAGRGAPAATVVVVALAVNARLLLYGAATVPWFGSRTPGRRLLLAVPMIDPLYALCADRFGRHDLDEGDRVRFYLGAAGTLAGTWVVGQAVALAAGPALSGGSALELAAPLAFAGMLPRLVRGRPELVATVVAAAVVVIAGRSLPAGSVTVVAPLVAVVVGGKVRRREAA